MFALRRRRPTVKSLSKAHQDRRAAVCGEGAERVERDIYNHWNATAKQLSGWYSSYRAGGAVPGFQFKTRENADAFLAFIGGNAEQTRAPLRIAATPLLTTSLNLPSSA